MIRYTCRNCGSQYLALDLSPDPHHCPACHTSAGAAPKPTRKRARKPQATTTTTTPDLPKEP